MERKILFDILASRAQEYPRNARSYFKASADITNTKKVRRLAAVLLPLPSSVFYALAMMAQAAKELVAAEALDLVRRDLKPANLMLLRGRNSWSRSLASD
jgi:hypothetical protein